jgi:hypothetical protein
MDFKELIKKWDEVLNEGKPIQNPKVKRATALMLENEHRWLNETGSTTQGSFDRAGSYATSGDFYKIAVPMVRRTFPELIAHDIVGVQPMTGPVGLAFALRFRAGQTYTGGASHGTEVGYNTIDKDYTYSASVSAQEALGSKAGSGVGNDFGLGVGSGSHIKEVNMTVEKTQVEAKTRKLRSRWSLEVAQDLKAMHGLELEDEMMDILAYEITAEIDRELVAAIKTAATLSTATSAGWSYTAADGRWEAEKYRNLYNMVIRKANQIAINTRRGAGNWLVSHPTVCAALECLSAFTIAPVQSDVSTAATGIARLGSLDGRLNVYRDTFSTTEEIIIGYKGPSEYDTGVIYCPYVVLLNSKATLEDSFNPTVGLMSRYAIVNHLFGSYNFYQYIDVNNMP